MACLRRWFVTMAVGLALLAGLTNCVVAPVHPVSSGYVVTPPVVVIRPHRSYRYYRPYHPYRSHYGWYPYSYRW
jgi:hypothetical protein